MTPVIGCLHPAQVKWGVVWWGSRVGIKPRKEPINNSFGGCRGMVRMPLRGGERGGVV